jgi:hypothetical protein
MVVAVVAAALQLLLDMQCGVIQNIFTAET